MPSAKKQLKNKQNKPNLKNHDSLKKAYALKNTGDFNPNKYHDLSNIIESGDYGLDVLGNTISDQVIPGKIINLGNQLHEENPSEYGRGINMGLELTKNITPFWGDAGINALQKGVSYLSNENPKGIDRAYENYFNNEKGPKYSNGGNLNRVKSDPIRIQKNKQIQKENKDLNFVSRIEDPSLTFPDSQGNPMTHYMASADNIVFPTVVQQHGNNNLNKLGYEEAYEYANKSGEYIKFPSEKDAIDYGINYKQGTKLEEFNNGGYIKKLKYNKKGTYPTYEFPPMAFGGWLDTLPNQYADGGSLGDDPTPLVFDKNDPYGQMRYQAYNDSLNLYNRGEKSMQKLKSANNIQELEDYKNTNYYKEGQSAFNRLTKLNNKKPQVTHTLSKELPYTSESEDGSRWTSKGYKKPTIPIELIDRQPYSPVQTNPNSTVQLPISNISLQQMPTIGIGEPTFEGNNAYWKKQDNQLIYQNNDYSNNRNLPISNKPGDRFHQEPSWMVGDDRYYERDGEAYLVPQPKGGWKNKQILDPSSGKWKSKIVKKANGGWLDNL